MDADDTHGNDDGAADGTCASDDVSWLCDRPWADEALATAAPEETLRLPREGSVAELLCRRAAEMLDSACGQQGYDAYARAVHGFEEALQLWPENAAAREGELEARTAYAQRALASQDLDLAASLVSMEEPRHAELGRRIERARQQRSARQRLLSRLKQVAAVLAALVVVTTTVSMVTILKARDRAQAAERSAAEQWNLALGTLETLVNEVDAQLQDRPALEPLRQVLLDHAIDGLHRVAAAVDSAEESQQVDRNLAEAHSSLARIFFAARRRDEAERHQRRAVDIWYRLDGEEAVDPVEIARAERVLGPVQVDRRRCRHASGVIPWGLV